jgi:predicted alpha/beta-hydrolase family hydrolase
VCIEDHGGGLDQMFRMDRQRTDMPKPGKAQEVANPDNLQESLNMCARIDNGRLVVLC